MNNMTLLTYEQVVSKYKLDIFKKYGKGCKATDFAILLGADTSFSFYEDPKNLCSYWTKSKDLDYAFYSISRYGSLNFDSFKNRNNVIRPVLPYDSIPFSSINIINGPRDIRIGEYGDYPMWLASKKNSRKLELKYKRGNLKITGNSYTTDSIGCCECSVNFLARNHTEYEYNGKRYIRVIGDNNSNGKILSDGSIVKAGKVYWIEVSKVKWLIDENSNLLVSMYGLISGIYMHDTYENVVDFDNTFLKWFLGRYFSKELVQNYNKLHINNESEPEKIESFDKKYELVCLFSNLCEIEQSINNKYIEKLKEIKDNYSNLKNSLEKHKNQNKESTLFQDNESMEELIELFNKNRQLEEIIDNKYFGHKIKTKDICSNLNAMLNQTNEVSDEQILDIKKKIKKIY